VDARVFEFGTIAPGEKVDVLAEDRPDARWNKASVHRSARVNVSDVPYGIARSEYMTCRTAYRWMVALTSSCVK
jgi:hypothetical protein